MLNWGQSWDCNSGISTSPAVYSPYQGASGGLRQADLRLWERRGHLRPADLCLVALSCVRRAWGGSLPLPASPVEAGIRDCVISRPWRKQSASDTYACVFEGAAAWGSQLNFKPVGGRVLFHSANIY